jgi:hypothetical protein
MSTELLQRDRGSGNGSRIDRSPSKSAKKLLKVVREFGGYLAADRAFIPNYGDRCAPAPEKDPDLVLGIRGEPDREPTLRQEKTDEVDGTRCGHLLLQVHAQTPDGDLPPRGLELVSRQ